MTEAAPSWFRDAIAQAPVESVVDVQGVPIHTLAWGDPKLPGLLLVHGGAAHAHWWSFLAPLLSQRYYVVAPDLSGHGDSGRRSGYPRRIWADELLGVIRATDFVSPPIVVGHSMGGMVSIIMASVYGDQLAGAIIVDAPVRKPDPESDSARRGTEFRNPKVYPDRATAKRHFRLVPAQPCENAYILDYIAEHSLRELPDGGVTWKFDPTVFVRMSNDLMSDYLASVRCRIALMRGEHSRVVPPETGEYMFELLDRNAPLVEIPEAHHHLLLDQPLAFIAALRALLSDWEHSVPRKPKAQSA
ncbi:MAG TPA: alpha/beta hydrolase [Polyangiales bacterium]|nr:alpha/beta hydrolase [Polyangiales bacterium]